MIDHDVAPLIAIGGGCTALFALLCIVVLRKRRREVQGPRKTSFYAVAIDPSIAERGRAAFEAVPSAPEPVATAATQIAPVITPYVQMPAIFSPQAACGSALPPREPRRFARGSAPGIDHGLPARPQGWEQHAPRVTARIRATRRTR